MARNALRMIAAALLVGTATPAAAETATLTGRVACRNGKAVGGVWVVYEDGRTAAASWSRLTAPWIANYRISVTTPAAVRLRVGCGTASGTVYSMNDTAFLTLSASAARSVLCNEPTGTAPPATRCARWAGKALVGMPFPGVIAKEYETLPHYGKAPTLGGDFATDIYAAAGTPVRPRIYGPTKDYALKVVSRGSNCGGTWVSVGVYRGSTKIGEVDYAHLYRVPSTIAAGAAVKPATTIGYLQPYDRPQGCSYWRVSSPSGVHAHVEVATSSGTACWIGAVFQKRLAETRRWAEVRPGWTSTTC